MFKRQEPETSDRIAIDLGAYRTRFYSATRGLIFDQPSVGVVNMDHRVGGIAATGPFGNLAESLLSANHQHLRRVQPLQADNQNDLRMSVKMLQFFIARSKRSGALGKASHLSVMTPYHDTSNAIDQLLQVCIASGASTADITDTSEAAFYGLQIDHEEPCIMIDFGATSTRLIAIADRQTQLYQSIPIGGDTLERAIQNGMLQQFEVQVSDETAREIKHQVGTATAQSLVQYTQNSYHCNCRSVPSNETIQLRVNSDIINRILKPYLDNLARSIRLAFSGIQPAIKDAAYYNGVQLFGGGSLMPRIDQLVMAATDLPVVIADRPLTCAARGAAALLRAEMKDDRIQTENPEDSENSTSVEDGQPA